MQARMNNPAMVLPGTMPAIQALFQATGQADVPPATLELVHLRTSQINGCSACVDSGARSAKKAGETDALLAALATGELDAALIGLGRYDRPPPGMESLLAAREPVVVAISPEHPLARRGSITLTALKDTPMVAFTSASKQRSNLEAACRAAGFTPRIVAETSDPGVTIELIHQQIGVAVLPKSMVEGTAAVTQLSLTRPRLDRRILFTWHAAHSTPAARALLTLVRHHLAGPEAAASTRSPGSKKLNAEC